VTMVGMNLPLMRELANSFRQQSDDLNQCAQRLDRLSQNVDWLGRDGDAFRSDCRSNRPQLATIGTALATMHDLLTAQIDEQERTSADQPGVPTAPAPGQPRGLPNPTTGIPIPGLPWDLRLPTPEEWTQFESGLEQWAFERATDAQKFINWLPPDVSNGLEWLAGPESLSIPDVTAMVPGLQSAMGAGLDWLEPSDLPPLKYAQDQAKQYLGFTYNKDGDFYTTTENSLQSRLGYEDAYDYLHKGLGMDIGHQVVNFTADGKDYRLEFWKGAYGGGASYGGEIGLYVRDPNATGVDAARQAANPDYYPAAGPNDQIRMTQTIFDKDSGKDLMTNDNAGSTDGDHYWNLMLRTDPGYDFADLGQKGTLYVTDPETRASMYQAMKGKHDITDVRIGESGEITYTWKP
jgi:hypothetical protein